MLAPASALAPAAPYRSRFQRLLSRMRWAALAVLSLWALGCFGLLRSADVATRVIGHDAAPSIAAAERIRSLLSDADGELANILLTHETDGGRFSKALDDDIAAAEATLVDAAQNITYGDAEKIPITQMTRGVAQYAELVGEARALGSAALALKADALMRDTILPAALALDRANDEPLSARYQDFAQSRLLLLGAFAALTLAALGVLGYLQWRMFTDARRILNPGVAATSALVAAFSLYAASAFTVALVELKVAKQDAFDSVYALNQLEAVANEANAAESFWLLAFDDPAQNKFYEDRFHRLANEVLARDPATARRTDFAHERVGGLLGEELANITFTGEADAARKTLRAWLVYLDTDVTLRALRNSGKTGEAVALDVGTAPGQSDWAFDQFLFALKATTKINQNEFDAAIQRSERAVNLTLYLVLGLVYAAACGAAWAGVRMRLAEYEF